MPKCSVCGTSKFFLKLTNNVCNKCLDFANLCDNNYKTFFKNITDESVNKDKLIFDILDLSAHVKQLENSGLCSISSKDCDKLLEFITAVIPSINVSKKDDKVIITHIIYNPLLERKLNSNKVMSVSPSKSTPEVISLNKTLNTVSTPLSCSNEKLCFSSDYVAFSIETTGMKINSKNSIIEIAAVHVHHGKVKDTFHSLIKPFENRNFPSEDSLDISNTLLSNASTLDIVLQNFIKFCDGLTLVTHNVNFNYKFLDFYSRKIFKKPLCMDTICTIKLYRINYRQFYKKQAQDCNLLTCCLQLLSSEDLSLIENISSPTLSSAFATFKLYEILKTNSD